MKFIDLHCDTLSRAFRGDAPLPLAENSLQVDIQRLKASHCAAQFFAVFIPTEKVPDYHKRCINIIDYFHTQLSLNNTEIAFAGSANDLMKNETAGKVSAFLTIEDSGILNCDIDLLDSFYKKGVRLITLTWNYKNGVGYPNITEEYSRCGLSTHGIEFVRECQRLGIAVDVSHLSDEGFWDVARISKKPFTASHSNARSIASCSRNLTDDMLRTLGNCGGVAGLNFCGAFVKPRTGDVYAPFINEDCTMEDIVMHAQHMVNVGGEDCVALGSDFDGISSWPEELDDVAAIPRLAEVFLNSGFSVRQTEKIFYRNAERFIKDTMT